MLKLLWNTQQKPLKASELGREWNWISSKVPFISWIPAELPNLDYIMSFETKAGKGRNENGRKKRAGR